MNKTEKFENERADRIATQSDESFKKQSIEWAKTAMDKEYVYNFEWMGRPIIQFPQDIMALQELIWKIQPDLIIETGIAHGGSLIFSASILELIGKPAEVIGIDIHIREHNRVEIEAHPMFKRIRLIEGSSTAPEVVQQVITLAKNKSKVMVILDSMHTHQHVLDELNAYAPLVSKGSYIVVLDTFIEDLPKGYFENRPWDIGNNPKTAVHEYLKSDQSFEIDHTYDDKLMITVAPDGFLKKSD
jgi:cephalosporin hydroxylase